MTIDARPRHAAPAGGLQPRALIVTVYGLYARESAGWLAVSTLIRLMAEVGVDEPAVRSAISRLKRRGVLASRTLGGAAGYELSDHGRLILAEGDRRIFGRDRAGLDAGWVLAVFSVPESERRERHRLRSRLSWLGFGTVSAGVWIAPAHLQEEALDALRRDGLTPYVDLFRADHVGFGDLAAEVSSWWDLDDLAAMYEDFTAQYAPLARRWRRRRVVDPAVAFADYVVALTAWRRLPYLDPGLPLDVLPARWPGARAEEVFDELREQLSDAAHDHLDGVLSVIGTPA